MSGATQEIHERLIVFEYGTVTLFGRLSHAVLLTMNFVTLLPYYDQAVTPTTPERQ